MAWTDERIAKLKQGWEGGMTATQIAEMLGEVALREKLLASTDATELYQLISGWQSALAS